MSVRARLLQLAYDPSWNPYPEQDWQILWEVHRDRPEAVNWYAEFAFDAECPNWKPMLDLLYFATGESVMVRAEKSAHLPRELENLIVKFEASEEHSGILQRRAWRADALFKQQVKFDYSYWCDSGFQFEA